MNKCYCIVILFCVYSLCNTGTTWAQHGNDRNFLVKQGLLQYSQNKYAYAERKLSEWINVNPSVSDTAVFKDLADCYWISRKYTDAYQLYWRLKGMSDFKLSSNMLMRMSDMEAMRGNYAVAASLLDPVNNMQEKSNGFLHITDQVRDSSDWTLVYPQFNTIVGEYLPYVYQNYFILTTDRYRKSLFNSRQVNMFTGGQFSRMQYLNDTASISCSIIDYEYKHGSIKNFDVTRSRSRVKNMAVSHEFSDAPLLNHSLINWSHDMETFGGLKTLEIKPRNSLNVGYLSVQAKNDSSGKTMAYYVGSSVEKKWKRKYSRDHNAILPLVLFRGELVINKKDNLNIVKACAMKIEGFTGDIIHASVSRDGKVMVFSGHTKIKPDFDLYYATRKSENSWEKPHLFGTNINTERSEVFPQLQEDGTLYFSSDGLPGLGALDIFRIPFYCKDTIREDGQPEHLGYPLNSAFDDFGLTVSSHFVEKINEVDVHSVNGYFSTNRSGNDDIYRFSYHEKYIQLCGEVFGTMEGDSKPEFLKGATVFLHLQDEKGNSVLADSVLTDRYGHYCLNVRPNREYQLEFNKPGWTSIKGNVATDIAADPSEFITYEPIFLNQLPGKTSKENSSDSPAPGTGFEKTFIVYHYFDQSGVVSAYLPVVDSAIAYSKAHATANVELVSASDCIGTARYSIKLSERRALYMKKLLEEKGITITSFRGVGQSQKMVECLYPLRVEQQLPNRYTKIVIRGYIQQK